MGLKLPKYKPICIEANLLKRPYPAKTGRLIKYKTIEAVYGLGITHIFSASFLRMLR